MFFKKKKKREQILIKDEPFVIPSIDKEVKELLDRKRDFKNTKFVSPHFGSSVKDETIKPESSSLGDIKKSYDAFRKPEDKQFKREDIKKQYGTEYFEFDLISNHTRKEIFGEDCLIVEEKTQNQKKSLETFSDLIKPKEEVLKKKAEIKNEVRENAIKVDQLFQNIDVFEEKIVTSEDILEHDFETKTNNNDESSEKDDVIIFEDEFYESEDHPSYTAEPKGIKENIVYTKKDDFYSHDTSLKDEKTVNPKITENPFNEKVVRNKFANYKFPPIDLLSVKDLRYDTKEEWIDEQIDIINRTLLEFDVSGHVESFKKGPTVTRYEIKLEQGVLVRKILNIENNLKMNLAAKTLRIQAPIPGKPNVGIEVPNRKNEIVPFGNLCHDDKFKYSDKKLLVGLGVNIDGENTYYDLGKMPHGLIAGSTGSGKSVCINTILISLLFKNSPEDLKLMLIDPKRVELLNYNDLPHLVTPVITDAKIASTGLKWAVDEMERRYTIFAEHRAKDIASYNEKISGNSSFKKMPYIVIVIDELADLMMVCNQDVEDAIQRITQKARACGIHLLVATQRPTTDVVKGTIKANIPTRLAFKVASYTDSITILDSAGADQLLGYGDCLFKVNDTLERIQGAYVSDQEIENVTNFIRDQNETDYYFMHDQLISKQSSDSSSEDELVYEVGKFVIMNNQASINAITKYYKIGFNRGQRIVEILEEMGVVSSALGRKSRDILVSIEEFEEMF